MNFNPVKHVLISLFDILCLYKKAREEFLLPLCFLFVAMIVIFSSFFYIMRNKNEEKNIVIDEVRLFEDCSLLTQQQVVPLLADASGQKVGVSESSLRYRYLLSGLSKEVEFPGLNRSMVLLINETAVPVESIDHLQQQARRVTAEYIDQQSSIYDPTSSLMPSSYYIIPLSPFLQENISGVENVWRVRPDSEKFSHISFNLLPEESQAQYARIYLTLNDGRPGAPMCHSMRETNAIVQMTYQYTAYREIKGIYYFLFIMSLLISLSAGYKMQKARNDGNLEIWLAGQKNPLLPYFLPRALLYSLFIFSCLISSPWLLSLELAIHLFLFLLLSSCCFFAMFFYQSLVTFWYHSIIGRSFSAYLLRPISIVVFSLIFRLITMLYEQDPNHIFWISPLVSLSYIGLGVLFWKWTQKRIGSRREGLRKT